jgi:hypothetical protein
LSEVERSIAALAVKKIYRGTHTSAQAFELDVKDWIEHWNDEPRPSVWAKTPHQILDSLARSRERVSAAPSTSSRPWPNSSTNFRSRREIKSYPRYTSGTGHW